jgi:hypothetical protein
MVAVGGLVWRGMAARSVAVAVARSVVIAVAVVGAIARKFLGVHIGRSADGLQIFKSSLLFLKCTPRVEEEELTFFPGDPNHIDWTVPVPRLENRKLIPSATAMLHLDWKSFFAARAYNDLGNKNTSVYTKAWSPIKEDNTRFQTLVADTDNVILATDTDNKIHALHSFKVVGGTLLCPTTKLMCLLGTGAHATALLVDKQSLLNPCNLVTPTIDKLQACSNRDEVNKIAEPDKTGAGTYPGSASFFPTPWLVKTIMSTRPSKPLKLIPAANAAAIKFDAEHEHNEDYTTTAADHAGDFILWAWGVKAGKVSTTRLTMDPNDANLERFCNKRHQSCITQALWNNIPGGLPPPPAGDEAGILSLLNATIACKVEEQEAQNNILTIQHTT